MILQTLAWLSANKNSRYIAVGRDKKPDANLKGNQFTGLFCFLKYANIYFLRKSQMKKELPTTFIQGTLSNI